MRMDDIKEMAKKDMVIDQFELADESIKVASLHQKYIDILSDEVLLLKRAQGELKKVQRELWLYYTGKADKDVYDRKGAFNLKVMKSDLTMFIESDDEYLEKSFIVQRQEEKVAYLESILKQIANRHWQIRNAIEWRRFTECQT